MTWVVLRETNNLKYTLYFHAQPSLEFTDNGPKKYSVSGSSVGQNALLMSEEKGNSNLYNSLQQKVYRRASLNLRHVEPWSRWATAADRFSDSLWI